MIEATVLNSFFEKIADLVYGPERGRISAVGAFVARKGGAAEFQRLLGEHRSFQKARDAYRKKYPTDFITLAFRKEEPPTRGGFLGFGADKYYDEKRKDFESRIASPRVFIREGPAGGYAQGAFYKEVARARYDRELNKPWIPKKDRVVYI